jgi:hypothetical protein
MVSTIKSKVIKIDEIALAKSSCIAPLLPRLRQKAGRSRGSGKQRANNAESTGDKIKLFDRYVDKIKDFR